MINVYKRGNRQNCLVFNGSVLTHTYFCCYPDHRMFVVRYTFRSPFCKHLLIVPHYFMIISKEVGITTFKDYFLTNFLVFRLFLGHPWYGFVGFFYYFAHFFIPLESVRRLVLMLVLRQLFPPPMALAMSAPRLQDLPLLFQKPVLPSPVRTLLQVLEFVPVPD